MNAALSLAKTMFNPHAKRRKNKPMNAVQAVAHLETYTSENQLQNLVVKRLRPLEDALGFRVVAIPNGGKRRAKEAAQLKNRGVRAGFPDLMILRKHDIAPLYAQSIFIELKVADGSLSDEQVEWHTWLGGMMFPVHVCTSVPSVLTVLRSYGLKV